VISTLGGVGHGGCTTGQHTLAVSGQPESSPAISPGFGAPPSGLSMAGTNRFDAARWRRQATLSREPGFLIRKFAARTDSARIADLDAPAEDVNNWHQNSHLPSIFIYVRNSGVRGTFRADSSRYRIEWLECQEKPGRYWLYRIPRDNAARRHFVCVINRVFSQPRISVNQIWIIEP